MGNRDNRIIKASFRDCPISDRKQFMHSKCIMPISIGQKVHEGQKLSSVISLVNNSFKQCTLLIDDTIQRYTLNIEEPDKSDAYLYEKTEQLGKEWFERNKRIIDSFTIPYRVIHWNYWVSKPEFKYQYEVIESLYQSNRHYRDAIHENIRLFLARRYLLDEHNSNYSHAFGCCLQYLKEECAVMCLWAEEEYLFEVYPTNRNHAMVATHEYLIKPRSPYLLRSVSLRFKKYPSSKNSNNEQVVKEVT